MPNQLLLVPASQLTSSSSSSHQPRPSDPKRRISGNGATQTTNSQKKTTSTSSTGTKKGPPGPIQSRLNFTPKPGVGGNDTPKSSSKKKGNSAGSSTRKTIASSSKTKATNIKDLLRNQARRSSSATAPEGADDSGIQISSGKRRRGESSERSRSRSIAGGDEEEDDNEDRYEQVLQEKEREKKRSRLSTMEAEPSPLSRRDRASGGNRNRSTAGGVLTLFGVDGLPGSSNVQSRRSRKSITHQSDSEEDNSSDREQPKASTSSTSKSKQSANFLTTNGPTAVNNPKGKRLRSKPVTPSKSISRFSTASPSSSPPFPVQPPPQHRSSSESGPHFRSIAFEDDPNLSLLPLSQEMISESKFQDHVALLGMDAKRRAKKSAEMPWRVNPMPDPFVRARQEEKEERKRREVIEASQRRRRRGMGIYSSGEEPQEEHDQDLQDEDTQMGVGYEEEEGQETQMADFDVGNFDFEKDVMSRILRNSNSRDMGVEADRMEVDEPMMNQGESSRREREVLEINSSPVQSPGAGYSNPRQQPVDGLPSQQQRSQTQTQSYIGGGQPVPSSGKHPDSYTLPESEDWPSPPPRRTTNVLTGSIRIPSPLGPNAHQRSTLRTPEKSRTTPQHLRMYSGSRGRNSPVGIGSPSPLRVQLLSGFQRLSPSRAPSRSVTPRTLRVAPVETMVLSPRSLGAFEGVETLAVWSPYRAGGGGMSLRNGQAIGMGQIGEENEDEEDEVGVGAAPRKLTFGASNESITHHQEKEVDHAIQDPQVVVQDSQADEQVFPPTNPERSINILSSSQSSSSNSKAALPKVTASRAPLPASSQTLPESSTPQQPPQRNHLNPDLTATTSTRPAAMAFPGIDPAFTFAPPPQVEEGPSTSTSKPKSALKGKSKSRSSLGNQSQTQTQTQMGLKQFGFLSDQTIGLKNKDRSMAKGKARVEFGGVEFEDEDDLHFPAEDGDEDGESEEFDGVQETIYPSQPFLGGSGSGSDQAEEEEDSYVPSSQTLAPIYHHQPQNQNSNTNSRKRKLDNQDQDQSSSGISSSQPQSYNKRQRPRNLRNLPSAPLDPRLTKVGREEYLRRMGRFDGEDDIDQGRILIEETLAPGLAGVSRIERESVDTGPEVGDARVLVDETLAVPASTGLRGEDMDLGLVISDSEEGEGDITATVDEPRKNPVAITQGLALQQQQRQRQQRRSSTSMVPSSQDQDIVMVEDSEDENGEYVVPSSQFGEDVGTFSMDLGEGSYRFFREQAQAQAQGNSNGQESNSHAKSRSSLDSESTSQDIPTSESALYPPSLEDWWEGFNKSVNGG